MADFSDPNWPLSLPKALSALEYFPPPPDSLDLSQLKPVPQTNSAESDPVKWLKKSSLASRAIFYFSEDDEGRPSDVHRQVAELKAEIAGGSAKEYLGSNTISVMRGNLYDISSGSDEVSGRTLELSATTGLQVSLPLDDPSWSLVLRSPTAS